MKIVLASFLFLVTLSISSCSFGKSTNTEIKSPDYFKARFETTRGDFEIESYRKWSPLAVDRVYKLISNKYHSEVPFYRVLPDYVAQFGNFDPVASKKWDKIVVPDEPVLESNLLGTIAFARGGKNTRSAHLFINLKDNPNLDTLAFMEVKGFPVVARVTKGMEIVNNLFSYGDEPMSGLDSVVDSNKFFKETFPNMDYIKRAYIIK